MQMMARRARTGKKRVLDEEDDDEINDSEEGLQAPYLHRLIIATEAKPSSSSRGYSCHP